MLYKLIAAVCLLATPILAQIGAVDPSILKQAGATTGQGLVWDGTKWAPDDVAAGAHDLVGADHTVSGLTTGHVLQATGAATFGFGALTNSQIPTTLTDKTLVGPVTAAYNIASFPSVNEGGEVYAADGLTARDCTVGGGSNVVRCRWNGVSWNATGGETSPLYSTSIDTFAELDSLVADQTLVHSGSNIATATALASDPADCSAGSLAAGINASGVAQGCADPILETELDTIAELQTQIADATLLTTADEGTGNGIDADTVDGVEAAAFLLLTGGTLSGQLITSNLGVEFTESDTNPTCASGNYSVYADLSENKLKACQNGTASDLLGGGGSEVNNLESDGAADIASGEVFVGNGAGTGTYRVLAETDISDLTHTTDTTKTIEDEGTPLTTRSTMNFTGDGVAVTDAGGKTVVSITGGSGGSGTEIMVADWSVPAGLATSVYSKYIPADGTAAKFWCRAPTGDTFDVQIVQREIGVGTSNTFSAVQTCDDSPALVTTFADSSLTAGHVLELNISNVTGSPADEDELFVYFEATTPGGTVADDAIDTDKLDDGSETPIEDALVTVSSGKEFKYTEQGSGNGLDADTVDGVEAAALATLAGEETFATGTKTFTAKLDAGGGTLEIPNSTTLPGTCAVGESYMDTDATSGQRFYLCESTDTWALQGDGGSGGGTDSVGTDELDDASDAPVENYLAAVDSATTGFQYIQVGTGLAISGSEYARTLAIAATTVDTISAQTLEAKTLTDASLGDDSSLSRRVPNDSATGTANGDLAEIQDAGDNSEEAITIGTGDTNKHVYPVRTGGGTTGNVELAVIGEVQIDMDGACAVGDNVIASTSTAGEGSCTSAPLAQNVHCIGVATQAIGAAGLADVDLSAKCSRVAEGSGETRSFSWAITDPATGDSEALQWFAARAVTITALNCSTDTGTADIQLDERVLATPNTGGTDTMASALQCDSDNAQQTSFSNAGIAASALLNLDIDAVASSPTQLRIHVIYTVD